MGGSSPDRAAGPPEADLFPWLVTLGCLIVALALFAHSTMPALAEQEALRKVQEQKTEQLEETAREARELRRDTEAIGRDPERLIHVLDQHGLSPEDASEPR
jgi:hypothetical protein